MTERRGPMRLSQRRHGLCRRRYGFRTAAEQPAHFENTWHGHQQPRLMECPAICCVQMRLTPSSHAGRVCYPRGFIRQQGNDADPGMPRTDDRRAPHRDLASDSRGQIAIIDYRQPCAGLRAGAPRLSDRLIMRRANSCRLRRVPGLALNFLYIARRGADCVRLFCQFFLPKKCARITLYFGWYALDTRDRLGP